ncbi:Acetyltransferase, GNAT family [Citrobacter freundii]|uniref:Acetyltransferase, GNAT family n=1 Tax=Citrobacter freundii TaxID=546 RepID=A0A7G2IUJ6_CITFR|nr:Acetyltransferase, GNAT family [Citrobacter freundii]
MEEQTDPMHFAVIDLTSMKPVGTFALMRIDTSNGVIEVGHVSYSVRMKRSRISTEVISLLLKYVFEDLAIAVLNGNAMLSMLLPVGRRSALASVFEGIFRQAVVTRGRNRDTAWYSIIDGEYPSLRPAYDMWLDERNFDNQGRQIRRLGELMERG